MRESGCGLPAIVRLRRTQARRAGLRVAGYALRGAGNLRATGGAEVEMGKLE
jgi:hypothetical protein